MMIYGKRGLVFLCILSGTCIARVQLSKAMGNKRRHNYASHVTKLQRILVAFVVSITLYHHSWHSSGRADGAVPGKLG